MPVAPRLAAAEGDREWSASAGMTFEKVGEREETKGERREKSGGRER